MTHQNHNANYEDSLFASFVEDHKGFGAFRGDPLQRRKPMPNYGRLGISMAIALILVAILGGWWLMEHQITVTNTMETSGVNQLQAAKKANPFD